MDLDISGLMSSLYGRSFDTPDKMSPPIDPVLIRRALNSSLPGEDDPYQNNSGVNIGLYGEDMMGEDQDLGALFEAYMKFGGNNDSN